MTIRADVAIVGGGIAGAALAWRLAPRRRVALLEREAGFGAHATGRSAAEWSLVHAEGLIRILTDLSGPFLRQPPAGFADQPLVRGRGNVVYARPGETGALEALLARAREVQDDLEALSPAAAAARAPFLDPAALEAAFWDPANGEIDVDALLGACLRGARGEGAALLTDAPLTAAERRGGAWRLAAGGETVEAAVVVNAAGPWADEVAAMLGADGLGLVPKRRTMIIFDAAEGLDVRGLPSADDAASGFYLKPEAGRLLACPGDATPSAPCDAAPEEIDVATAAWMAQEIGGRPVRRIVSRWAGLRTFSPDGSPAVGWDPRAEGLFWMAGLGGAGLMTAPALSRAAADIFETGRVGEALARDGITETALSPGRF